MESPGGEPGECPINLELQGRHQPEGREGRVRSKGAHVTDRERGGQGEGWGCSKEGEREGQRGRERDRGRDGGRDRGGERDRGKDKGEGQRAGWGRDRWREGDLVS